MGGIQGWEWIWILIIALLLFGPKKLPDLGRAVGKSIREFKNATSGLLSDDEKKEQAQVQEPVVTSMPKIQVEPQAKVATTEPKPAQVQTTDHATKPQV
jgi:sec-independent protein translocase protein TatA